MSLSPLPHDVDECTSPDASMLNHDKGQSIKDLDIKDVDGKNVAGKGDHALTNVGAPDLRIGVSDTVKPLVVIPTYNEKDNIELLLDAIFDNLPSADVLIIDDASPDGTSDVVRSYSAGHRRVHLLVRVGKEGLGTAYVAGFRWALARDYTHVLGMDADFSHDPRDLPRLLAQATHHDLVIGSRYVLGGATPGWKWRRRVLSDVGNVVARATLGVPVRDLTTGYRCYRRDALAALDLDNIDVVGYGFMMETTYQCYRRGLRIAEVPITFVDRRAGQSKMSASIATESLRHVLRRRWQRMRQVRRVGAGTTWVDARPIRPVHIPPPDHVGASSAQVSYPTTTVASTQASGRLRILALNQRFVGHPEAGGSQRNLLEHVRHWVADGHEVTVITADPGRRHVALRTEIIEGATVHRMGGRLSLFVLAAIYLLRHGKRFDRILDVCDGIPFFTPLLTRTPQVLFVHHVHGPMWFTEFPRLLGLVGWFIEHRVVPLVYRRHTVIAVSSSTRDALTHIGFDHRDVRIVHSGIEPPTDVDNLLSGSRIAYVGRLKRYKRVDHLVRAMPTLRASFPALHLDIVGDGDAKPDIEALVEQLRLGDCVTIYGYVDEETKARVLRSATVFGMPSEVEGWALSVLEANTYGCPAVAYDVAGLCVSIKHDETGLLVGAGDEEAYRTALASVLADPTLRARLSQGALEWAATFDWRTTADETLQVLNSLKERRRPRSLVTSA